jgi:hypothetical protein
VNAIRSTPQCGVERCGRVGETAKRSEKFL